jgi:hypothetical protein
MRDTQTHTQPLPRTDSGDTHACTLVVAFPAVRTEHSCVKTESNLASYSFAFFKIIEVD